MRLTLLVIAREYRRRWPLVVSVVLIVATLSGSLLLSLVVYRPVRGDLSYPRLDRVWSVFQRGQDGRPVSRLDEAAVAAFLRLPHEQAWARGLGSTMVRRGTENVPLVTAGASPNLLPALGVHVLRGRLADETAAEPVLLSSDAWIRIFGSEEALVGKVVETDVGLLTIVGVLPPSFRMPWIGFEQPDLLRLTNEPPTAGISAWIATDTDAVNGNATEFDSLRLIPLREFLLGGFVDTARAAVVALALFSAQMVAALLLLFCALHATRQPRNFTEVALGKPASATIDAAIVEVGIFGIAGSLMAVPAVILLAGRIAKGPAVRELVARDMEVDADRVALAALIGLTLCALTYGVSVWRTKSVRTLAAGVIARPRALAGVSTWQMAIAVILGIATVATGMSVRTSLTRDVGLDPIGLYVADVAGPISLPTAADRRAYFVGVQERLERLFGVDSIAAIDALPLAGAFPQRPLLTDQHLKAEERGGIWQVSPNFFFVTGTQVVAGRAFSQEEARTGADVCVMSQRAATQLLGNPSPIGSVLNVSGTQCLIVGIAREATEVVRTGRSWGAYRPFSESTFRRMTLLIRSSHPPQEVAALATPAFINGTEQPRVRVVPASAFLASRVGDLGFLAPILSVSAIVVIAVSIISIYGTVAAQVGANSASYALQIALGVSTVHMVRETLRKTGWPIIRGAVVGTAGGWLYQQHLLATFSTLIAIPIWHFALALTLATLLAVLGCFSLALIVLRTYSSAVVSRLSPGR